jgi:hypothetical protein
MKRMMLLSIAMRRGRRRTTMTPAKNGNEELIIKKAKKLLEGRCFHEIKIQEPDNEGYYGSAECIYCDGLGWNSIFTWYCPDSPDHACHYHSDSDGKRRYTTDINGERIYLSKKHTDENARWETDDQCLFCGLPNERK